MVPRKELLQHGVVNHAIASGSFESPNKTPIMVNFYTSLAVMKYIYLSFSMLLVGTYALTKKNHAPQMTFRLRS